jgi:hypothetical protein
MGGAFMLASLAAPSHCSLLAALEGKPQPTRPAPMPSRRTIRKPTRWTPEEWRHIEAAAHECGVPPLRYVREAALVAKLPPSTATRARARRATHELVRQLTRVLSNLHQLARVADENGADSAALVLGVSIAVTDLAVKRAAVHRGAPNALAGLAADVVDAGQILNEIAHQANATQQMPALNDIIEALTRINSTILLVPG